MHARRNDNYINWSSRCKTQVPLIESNLDPHAASVCFESKTISQHHAARPDVGRVNVRWIACCIVGVCSRKNGEDFVTKRVNQGSPSLLKLPVTNHWDSAYRGVACWHSYRWRKKDEITVVGKDRREC